MILCSRMTDRKLRKPMADAPPNCKEVFCPQFVWKSSLYIDTKYNLNI